MGLEGPDLPQVPEEGPDAGLGVVSVNWAKAYAMLPRHMEMLGKTSAIGCFVPCLNQGQGILFGIQGADVGGGCGAVNRTRRTVDVKNCDAEEILRQVQRLRSSAGRKASLTIKRPVIPPGLRGASAEAIHKGHSTQGVWRPGMFDSPATFKATS